MKFSPVSFLVFSWFTFGQQSKASEVGYESVSISDARLVYEDDIKKRSNVGLEEAATTPSFHLIRNIDGIAHGDNYVIGLFKRDCWSYSASRYAPSDCGDEERVVILLKDIPEVGRRIDLFGKDDVVSAIVVGGFYGPSRSGCFGVPSDLYLHVIQNDGEKILIEIVGNYTLIAASDGRVSCGHRRIDGAYLLSFKSTNESLDGGFKRLIRDSLNSQLP